MRLLIDIPQVLINCFLMPHISVIIPTYNRQHFLIECLNSVFSQSYTDFECIVVDDGSTDKTKECLLKYQETNPLKIFSQKNKGPSAARNLGIYNSSGEWICFLDSDDLWLPKKLEQQINFFGKEPSYPICYTEEIWYRNGVRVNPHKKHRKYSGHIYNRLLPLCIISPSSVMINRIVFEKVGTFDETLPACEDYDLWLRIGASYPIHLITTPLIIKRNGHSSQLSNEVKIQDLYRIKSLTKMLSSKALSTENRKATLLMLQKKSEIYIQGCLKRGKTVEANHMKNEILQIMTKEKSIQS